MLRAVMTIKDLGVIALSTSVCVACGGSDSPVRPRVCRRRMEVRYVSDVSAEHQDVIAAAVDKWTRALSKNRGDFPLHTPANHCFAGAPRLYESHHNLLVFVSIGYIDGANGQLAFTTVCSISAEDDLPVVAHIRLDRNDLAWMEEQKVFAGVVTHEFGHALGVQPADLSGERARRGRCDRSVLQWQHGAGEIPETRGWYTGVTVPLGTAATRARTTPTGDSSVFWDELMAGELGPEYGCPERHYAGPFCRPRLHRGLFRGRFIRGSTPLRRQPVGPGEESHQRLQDRWSADYLEGPDLALTAPRW